jgi:hypothetical protein
VANYRAQFNTIVRSTSYAELVRRIRARVAVLAAPSAAGLDVIGHPAVYLVLETVLRERP